MLSIDSERVHGAFVKYYCVIVDVIGLIVDGIIVYDQYWFEDFT